MREYICNNVNCKELVNLEEGGTKLTYKSHTLYICNKCIQNISLRDFLEAYGYKDEEPKTKRNKPRQSIKKAVESYGEDKLINEYLSGKYSAKEIDALLGLKPNSIINYFNKKGINKRKILLNKLAQQEELERVKKEKSKVKIYNYKKVIERQKEKQLEKEKLKGIDIEEKRFDQEFLKKVQKLETVNGPIPSVCSKCVYRERSINHCWYTMATHKTIPKNKMTPNGNCSHFVDMEKLIDDK